MKALEHHFLFGHTKSSAGRDECVCNAERFFVAVIIFLLFQNRLDNRRIIRLKSHYSVLKARKGNDDGTSYRYRNCKKM